MFSLPASSTFITVLISPLFFLNDEFEITVVLDDRNVELRIRFSVSMPGKNFTV